MVAPAAASPIRAHLHRLPITHTSGPLAPSRMEFRAHVPHPQHASAVAPTGRALLRERAHGLAEVLRGQRGAAQLEQLALDALVELAAPCEQLPNHPLVAALGDRS